MKNNGFTLIEILIVVAVIAILSAIVIPSYAKVRSKTYYSRTMAEYASMWAAIEMYKEANGDYPPDVSRDIPPGLGAYLAGNNSNTWPKAPWPDSVYDWDNWVNPEDSSQRIYQISIRFCPVGGNLSQCNFPKEDWAENFGVDSAVYYCVKGACRSHINQPLNYPGYCVNCNK